MRRGDLVVWCGLLALACACGRAGLFGHGPEPTGSKTPSPSPTVTPPASIDPTQDPGDAKDGNANIGPDTPVNECFVLESVSAGEVVLGSVADLSEVPGRRMILWQVQDAAVASSGGDEPAAIDASNPPGLAGRWQMVEVTAEDTSGAGSVLTTDPPAADFFSTDAAAFQAAQACTVPEFDAVNVNGGGNPDDIVPEDDWDGSTGGLVAFFANDLSLNGLVDVSEAGFRGGVHHAWAVNSNDVETEDTADGNGGGKGEGIDGRAFTMEGRGQRANGAGGGNAHQGGGGGGSNAGAGGRGGKDRCEDDGNGNQFDSCDMQDTDHQTWGRGGQALDLPVWDDASNSPGWLLMGGGGGSGQSNTQNDDTGEGGSGGGVVLIFVQNLDGDGRIDADGADGSSSSSDGAGGGGGGGTVWLFADSVSNDTIGVRARGGDGADNDDPNFPMGPGGGGGGGRIRAELPGGAGETFQVDAGGNGDVTQHADEGYDGSLGATDGADGVVVTP